MENPDWYAVRGKVERALQDVFCKEKSPRILLMVDDNWIYAHSIWPSEQRDKARAALVRLAKRKGYLKET